jgi:hypothetical protein
MTSIHSSFSLLDLDFLRVERIWGRGTACPLARGIRDLAILLHSRGDLQAKQGNMAVPNGLFNIIQSFVQRKHLHPKSR